MSINLSKVIIVVLALGLAAASSFEVTPSRADLLDVELSLIQARLLKEARQKQSLKQLRAEAVRSSAKYACTNGQNPAKLPLKQYLEEFAKGPCSPVMVMAGIAETKLMIEIDCPVLQREHPAIFAQCGWTSCSDSYFSRSPRKSYRLWIPEVISPFTLFNPLSDNYQKCFSGLAGFQFDRSSGTARAASPRGVVIMPVGFTEDTERSSRCGWDAISSILPLYPMLNPHKWKAFDQLRVELEAEGYLVGLTAQALPYDWRLSITSNQVQQKFEKILERLFSVSGKKVSIVAHSFGNINTLHNLWKMNPEKKQKLVMRYFAMAPPFLGAPTTAAMMLGGSSAYHFKGLGLNFDSFKKTLGTFPSAFDLMPRKTYKHFENEPWMRSIKNRIANEGGEAVFEPLAVEDDIVTRLFPPQSHRCYANEWKARKSDCKSGLSEYYRIGEVNGEEITTENLADILEKYSFNELASQLFRQSHIPLFDEMPNPEVQTVILYNNFMTTGNDFVYKTDPKPRAVLDGTNFVEPDHVAMDSGDTSVLTVSSLLPGIKWAFEFEQKQPGAKPVVFLEMCSIANRKDKVYQIFEAGQPRVSSNEYQGVDCTCTSQGSEDACDHMGMISDDKMIAYIVNSLKDEQIAVGPKRFDSSEEAVVETYLRGCLMLLV